MNYSYTDYDETTGGSVLTVSSDFDAVYITQDQGCDRIYGRIQSMWDDDELESYLEELFCEYSL